MPSRTVETFPERVQLEGIKPELAAAVAVTVKTGHIVKQGDVIGKITTGGMYRRRTRTKTAGTGFADDSPNGQVEDASVFKAGDVLKKTDGTTIGTVLSVNPATTPDTVVLTGNAAVDVAAGVDVVGSDGSQVAKGVSDSETDGSQDTVIAAIIAGLLDESKLRGLDASAITELGGASMAGGIFKL